MQLLNHLHVGLHSVDMLCTGLEVTGMVSIAMRRDLNVVCPFTCQSSVRGIFC